MSGLFVSFEGGEASGKSTQARLLAERWRADGREVVLTREPGGSPNAERLRGLLLAPDADWSATAEILLHFAARAEHLERVVLPALARGAAVITDRFADSTLAYQGYGSGADRGLIEALTAALPRRPDRTIVLVVDGRTRQERLRARGAEADRYEAEDEAFHERVDEGFRTIAANDPARCALLDGDADMATVAARVLDAVSEVQEPEAPGGGRGKAPA